MTTSPPPARLTLVNDTECVRMLASGDWSARNALALDGLVRSSLSSIPVAKKLALDLTGINEIDTFGAWYLSHLIRTLKARGRDAEVTGLADRFAGLLTLVGEASEGEPLKPPAKWTPLGALEKLGQQTTDAWRSFGLLVNMLGAIGDAAWRTVLRPSTFRLTSAIHHIDRVGLQAVPIILLITFLIGCIIAQQGFFHFRKFGADDYVVDMVGILILREIGVLIVAIMVAGRSGSSYTAELGSMKMREEIDALRTMGFDPIQVLVLPRVLALVIALPILTFLGSMSALYGGELVAWLYGGMSPDIFVARLKDAISITHFKVGMIKAPFMALVIGVVACSEGLRVGGSAESLGLRTTASVVTAIFLVIVLDGLFAIFFASIGM